MTRQFIRAVGQYVAKSGAGARISRDGLAAMSHDAAADDAPDAVCSNMERSGLPANARAGTIVPRQAETCKARSYSRVANSRASRSDSGQRRSACSICWRWVSRRVCV